MRKKLLLCLFLSLALTVTMIPSVAFGTDYDEGMSFDESEVWYSFDFDESETVTLQAPGLSNVPEGEEVYWSWERCSKTGEWTEVCTEQDYTVPIKQATGEYMVTANAGGYNATCWVYVSVDTGLKITEEPENIDVDKGGTASLSVEATIYEGAGDIFYQWENYDEDNGEYVPVTGGTNVTGETTATLTVKNV